MNLIKWTFNLYNSVNWYISFILRLILVEFKEKSKYFHIEPILRLPNVYVSIETSEFFSISVAQNSNSETLVLKVCGLVSVSKAELS